MSYAEFDYWNIKEYVPDYVCDEILKNYTDFGDGLIHGGELSDTRKSGVCWIDEPFYKNLFFDVISRMNCDSGLNFNLQGLENLQLTRYVAPDGHYNFHIDSDGHSRRNVNESVRKLSMSCLLSDSSEFEGGIFQMQTGDAPYDIEMKKGDIVIFPSYKLHRVSPVTKGIRYSLVAWARGSAIV